MKVDAAILLMPTVFTNFRAFDQCIKILQETEIQKSNKIWMKLNIYFAKTKKSITATSLLSLQSKHTLIAVEKMRLSMF